MNQSTSVRLITTYVFFFYRRIKTIFIEFKIFFLFYKSLTVLSMRSILHNIASDTLRYLSPQTVVYFILGKCVHSYSTTTKIHLRFSLLSFRYINLCLNNSNFFFFNIWTIKGTRKSLSHCRSPWYILYWKIHQRNWGKGGVIPSLTFTK